MTPPSAVRALLAPHVVFLARALLVEDAAGSETSTSESNGMSTENVIWYYPVHMPFYPPFRQGNQSRPEVEQSGVSWAAASKRMWPPVQAFHH